MPRRILTLLAIKIINPPCPRLQGREGVYSKHFDACGPSSRALARRITPLNELTSVAHPSTRMRLPTCKRGWFCPADGKRLCNTPMWKPAAHKRILQSAMMSHTVLWREHLLCTLYFWALQSRDRPLTALWTGSALCRIVLHHSVPNPGYCSYKLESFVRKIHPSRRVIQHLLMMEKSRKWITLHLIVLFTVNLRQSILIHLRYI